MRVVFVTKKQKRLCVIIVKTKNQEEPLLRNWAPSESLCAMLYGSVLKNKLFRHSHTARHIYFVSVFLKRQKPRLFEPEKQIFVPSVAKGRKTEITLFRCWWVTPIRFPFIHHRIQVHLLRWCIKRKQSATSNNRKEKPKSEFVDIVERLKEKPRASAQKSYTGIVLLVFLRGDAYP